jgi:hypothetical protein
MLTAQRAGAPNTRPAFSRSGHRAMAGAVMLLAAGAVALGAAGHGSAPPRATVISMTAAGTAQQSLSGRWIWLSTS